MDHEMTADYIIAPPKEDLRTQREIILAALLAAERSGMEKAAKIVESNISDEFPEDDMSRQCELIAAEIRKLMEAE